MYGNNETLCCITGTNRVLQVDYTSTNKQTHSEKETKCVVTRGRGWGKGELAEGGKKYQGRVIR